MFLNPFGISLFILSISFCPFKESYILQIGVIILIVRIDDFEITEFYIGRYIITKWEMSGNTYSKLKETYVFEGTTESLTFSENGQYFYIRVDDSKTILLYDSASLSLVSKFTLKAKDANGADINMFFDISISYDGSYFLTKDGETMHIFTNRGEYVRNIAKRSNTIFAFNKTEYLYLQNLEYKSTNIISVDFLKDTEKVVYKVDKYLYYLYLNYDLNTFIIGSTYENFYGQFKQEVELTPIFDNNFSINNIAFKGNKIAGVGTYYTGSYYIIFYENNKLLWKTKIKTASSYGASFYGFNFTKDKSDVLVGVEKNLESFRYSRISELAHSSILMKAIHNLIFQNNGIIFIRGSREIWILDFENKIKVFYLDSNIVGSENINRSGSSVNGINFGIILDCNDFYKIGKFAIEILELDNKLFLKLFLNFVGCKSSMMNYS